MPRIVPNPIADLKHPLQRIENAISSLADKLRPVDALPDVHAELLAVNQTLLRVLESVEGLREDLAASGRTAPAPAPAARKRAAG
jgi:hypothetical protein